MKGDVNQFSPAAHRNLKRFFCGTDGRAVHLKGRSFTKANLRPGRTHSGEWWSFTVKIISVTFYLKNLKSKFRF